MELTARASFDMVWAIFSDSVMEELDAKPASLFQTSNIWRGPSVTKELESSFACFQSFFASRRRLQREAELCSRIAVESGLLALPPYLHPAGWGLEATMPDNLSKTAIDRTRINVREDYELQFWSVKFGVTKRRIKAAVQKVGTSAQDVAREVRKPKRPYRRATR